MTLRKMYPRPRVTSHGRVDLGSRRHRRILRSWGAITTGRDRTGCPPWPQGVVTRPTEVPPKDADGRPAPPGARVAPRRVVLPFLTRETSQRATHSTESATDIGPTHSQRSDKDPGTQRKPTELFPTPAITRDVGPYPQDLHLVSNETPVCT